MTEEIKNTERLYSDLLANGKQKEREFSKLFASTVQSDKFSDVNGHWDVSVKYDVKGLKRMSRGGQLDENNHWIELRNVNGKTGWLYGRADFFAFETQNYWVCVNKYTLQEFIAERVIKEFTDQPTHYKLYRREGRQDMCTLIPTIDLCYLGYMVRK